MAEMKKISIIIPTLNEAINLPLLIADLNLYPYEFELIIIDCGSSDLTKLIAQIGGAKIIKTKKANRGYQLYKGALNAEGEWFLFLHSDSRMNKKWPEKIQTLITNKSTKEYCWFFDFKINKKGIIWSLMEILIAIRSHVFHRPYGDQGLLINKELYFQVGGHKKIHIMEDLDLIIRLSKKTKIKGIGIELTTSSRKYISSNIISNSIKNAFLRYRWRQGESIKELAEEYYSKKIN
ncbi:TIGR04283 family arsenosugar biosynthesis glycosyltransferase [Prochlorococcus marinus]|uniref:TIGR04283 family arsenosugar biosynthesis glycosyltransferase n=1 Tax=Prochlorococcus marinus TaxID=1219 RepID=UPI0022B495E7|nr:TIGR04283 family arsenosugar biosynthesis glycosyltransferase [Prochlorococcus marinus]